MTTPVSVKNKIKCLIKKKTDDEMRIVDFIPILQMLGQFKLMKKKSGECFN